MGKKGDDTILNNSNVKEAISVTTVVFCEIQVLVFENDGKYYFPSSYLLFGEEDCKRRSTKMVQNILKYKQSENKWMFADVRSDIDRKNYDDKYSVDIGHMTILESRDIPKPENNKYKWIQVNLEDENFPVQLGSDHKKLWDSARFMLDIVLSK